MKKMIEWYVLEKLADGLHPKYIIENFKDDWESLMVRISTELMTTRKNNDELLEALRTCQQKYNDATTYCEKHANFEGMCCIPCLHDLLEKTKQQNKELIEDGERLADVIISEGLTQDHGIDRTDNEHMKQHLDLMSRIEGEK